MKLAIFLLISPACIVLTAAAIVLAVPVWGLIAAWMLSHPEPQQP